MCADSALVSLVTSAEDVSSLTKILQERCGGGLNIEDVVALATHCLSLFIQLNWTGPPEASIRDEIVGQVGEEQWRQLNQDTVEKLRVDEVTPYKLSSGLLLLYVAQVVLDYLRGSGGNSCRRSLQVLVLAMRCVHTHQLLLEEKCSTLWLKLSDLMDDIKSQLDSSSISRAEKSVLYLEMGHICLYYLQYDAAQEFFEKARKLVGLEATLTGALGRRTKFQERAVAQLVIQVSTSQPQDSHISSHDHTSTDEHTYTDEHASSLSACPRDVGLDDDTLLDQVHFSVSSQEESSSSLNSIQQATLLALCCYSRKTKPVDSLSEEEVDAHVRFVLKSPRSWSVKSYALFLRCSLGKGRSRLQQRNMQQLEELVEAHGRAVPCAENRSWLCRAVPLPSIWTLQKALAQSLMTLGCYGSAVEILERLELWEELALCYIATDRRAKAKRLILQQLEVQTTPSLLCLLGDITQDTCYYERAWQESGCRSARAQKSLGMHYLKEKAWSRCVECLQLSLQVNPLQEGLWFTLACAAARLHDVDLSIRAGHQAVTLDPSCAEAWNNLAGQYLKKNNKEKAHRLFKEALRCSYDNVKIWENYLLIGIELHRWVESIEACHRLLDLEACQVVDAEILSLLVEAVGEAVPVEGVASKEGVVLKEGVVSEENVSSAGGLHNSVAKLLSRVVCQKSVPTAVWEACAHFHLKSTKPADAIKGVAELQKAQRMCRQKSGWEREWQSLVRVSRLTLDYSRACRNVYKPSENPVFSDKEANMALSSAKLAVQGVLAKVKVFGLASTPDLERMSQDLEEEKELLLQLMST